LVCAVATRACARVSVRVLLVVALFVYASPVAHFASVYSSLAVTLALAGLWMLLLWLDPACLSSSERNQTMLVFAGGLCGLAFDAKPNTGLLALGAVAATVAFASLQTRGTRATARALVCVVGAFGVVVVAMLVPIVWSGTLADLVGDVF